MKAAYRFALFSAIGFAVLSVGVGTFYYLHARPTWSQPQKHQLIEKVLQDPATPVDVVRKTALDGHDLLSKAYVALDSALELLLTFGFGAALLFGYLAYAVRKAAKEAQSAP